MKLRAHWRKMSDWRGKGGRLKSGRMGEHITGSRPGQEDRPASSEVGEGESRWPGSRGAAGAEEDTARVSTCDLPSW